MEDEQPPPPPAKGAADQPLEMLTANRERFRPSAEDKLPHPVSIAIAADRAAHDAEGQSHCPSDFGIYKNSFNRHEFRIYKKGMEISFDREKRDEVLRDHGLDLADAGRLLDGICFELPDDRFDYGEDRWISIGMLGGEVVVCAWADWGDDHIRVITMWKAKPNERKRYFRYLADIV